MPQHTYDPTCGLSRGDARVIADAALGKVVQLVALPYVLQTVREVCRMVTPELHPGGRPGSVDLLLVNADYLEGKSDVCMKPLLPLLREGGSIGVVGVAGGQRVFGVWALGCRVWSPSDGLWFFWQEGPRIGCPLWGDGESVPRGIVAKSPGKRISKQRKMGNRGS